MLATTVALSKGNFQTEPQNLTWMLHQVGGLGSSDQSFQAEKTQQWTTRMKDTPKYH